MATKTTTKSKKGYVTGTLPDGSKSTFVSADVAKQYNAKLDSPAPAAPQTFRYTQPPATTSAPTPTKPVYQDVDEDEIRESTRKRMQSSIDAINVHYANLVQQENLRGDDRSGQTRSVNARSGLIGSDFGTAQQQKTTQFNKEQVESLESEKQNKIQSVLYNIEDRASQAIADARAQAEGRYQREAGEYEKAQESARADMMALAKSGYNIEAMEPAKKDALFRQAGYGDSVLGALIFNAHKPKPAQIDYQFIEQKDGSVLAVGLDPATGQLRREVIEGVSPDVGLVIDMISKYPDAGILPSDDLLTASQKIRGSRIFSKDTHITPTGITPPSGDPVVDSWVAQIKAGQASIANVPANLKNAVVTALNAAPAGNPQALETAQQALAAVDALSSHAGKKGAVGSKGLSSLFGLKSTPMGGTAAAGFVAELDRVKSLLTLPNLQYLKGLGAMSDREFATLQAASTALNRDMSEGDFDREVERIKTALNATVTKLQSGAQPAATGAEDLRTKYNY